MNPELQPFFMLLDPTNMQSTGNQISSEDILVSEEQVYQSPEIFVIGRARNLIQSYSDGKYSDGYTGYYWER